MPRGRPIRRRLDSSSSDEATPVAAVPSRKANLLSFDDDDDEIMVKPKPKGKHRTMARPDLIAAQEADARARSRRHTNTQVSQHGEYTSDKLRLLQRNVISYSSHAADPPVVGSIVEDEDGDMGSSIPDAMVIREARLLREKQRQQLSTGDVPDFIPLKNDKDGEESRLIREDQDDEEPEVYEGDEGETLQMRNVLPGAIPRFDPSQLSGIKSAAEEDHDKRRREEIRMEIREGAVLSGDAVALTKGDNVDDEDDVMVRWEREQIRKGGAKDKILPQTTTAGVDALLAAPDSIKNTGITVETALEKLEQALKMCTHDESIAGRVITSLQSDIAEKKKQIAELDADQDLAEKEVSFFERIKGYVIDLLDFLDEKAPLIEELQSDIQQLDLEIESARRRWKGDLLIDTVQSVTDTRTVGPTRDAMRRRARIARAQYYASRQRTDPAGLSDSEDEEDDERHEKLVKRQGLIQQVEHLFDDAADDFAHVDKVRSIFEQWKMRYPRRYRDAFVATSIPPVMAPYVRQEVTLWRPLEMSEFENMAWYRSLFSYGTVEGEEDPNDPDNVLVPVLVERVVLPYVHRVIMHQWRPQSTRQTSNIVTVVESIGVYVEYPQPGAYSLVEALLDRLTGAIKMLEVPIIAMKYQPISVDPARIDDPDTVVNDAVLFCRYQFHAGIRLLRNAAMCWRVVSSTGRSSDPQTLIQIVVGQLIGQKLIPFIQNTTDVSARTELLSQVIYSLPENWRAPGGTGLIVPGLIVLKELVQHAGSDELLARIV